MPYFNLFISFLISGVILCGIALLFFRRADFGVMDTVNPFRPSKSFRRPGIVIYSIGALSMLASFVALIAGEFI